MHEIRATILPEHVTETVRLARASAGAILLRPASSTTTLRQSSLLHSFCLFSPRFSRLASEYGAAIGD
jgi:hypothetical protein